MAVAAVVAAAEAGAVAAAVVSASRVIILAAGTSALNACQIPLLLFCGAERWSQDARHANLQSSMRYYGNSYIIIGIILGLYRDNEKENGNYRDYRDYYRDHIGVI